MRRYRNVILVFALLLSATWASAQSVKKIAVDKQRAVQWKPATGQYYFSHSLVFDYENKADKTKGTVKIYVDPVTGAMCFRKESSFGQSGKAYDFIIGFPDGKYIYCGADDKGKKIKVTEMVKEFKPDAETKTQQKEDFITYCVPTGNKGRILTWKVRNTTSAMPLLKPKINYGLPKHHLAFMHYMELNLWKVP
jgi:hypothetical protein